jgi:hypothetical protein
MVPHMLGHVPLAGISLMCQQLVEEVPFGAQTLRMSLFYFSRHLHLQPEKQLSQSDPTCRQPSGSTYPYQQR